MAWINWYIVLLISLYYAYYYLDKEHNKYLTQQYFHNAEIQNIEQANDLLMEIDQPKSVAPNTLSK